MRRLIIFLLFLVASVWFGLLVLRHPGYLFIVYQPWMVQMPLWLALLSFIVLMSLFYLLIDSIDRLQFLWFRLKNWIHIRRVNQSFSKTQHGLVMLIEGQWRKAERLLIAGARQTKEPLMNYLGAAKAAHEQGAFEKRDSYIKKAYQAAPFADLAIGLTQADLEIAQDKLEQAMATLNHLQQLSPLHPRVLKLLEKVYARLGDFKQLNALLPSLRKAKVITKEQAEQFEKNIYCEILNASHQKDLADIRKLWDTIPKQVKKNPEVVFQYCQR